MVTKWWCGSDGDVSGWQAAGAASRETGQWRAAAGPGKARRLRKKGVDWDWDGEEEAKRSETAGKGG